MRVLFVNHTSAVSGAEHSLLVLMGGMPRDAVAGLACPAGPLADLAESRGVSVHRVRGTGGSLRLHPWRTPVAVAEIASSGVALAGVAKRAGSSVLHANSLRAGLIAGTATRFRRGGICDACPGLPSRIIHYSAHSSTGREIG